MCSAVESDCITGCFIDEATQCLMAVLLGVLWCSSVFDGAAQSSTRCKSVYDGTPQCLMVQLGV